MLREYKVGNKVVKVEPYNALPCSLMIFTIDDVDADTYYFGSGEDKNFWDAEEYACGDWRFERNNDIESMKKCMEKYSLTWEEYIGICEILEDVLCVGSCGWCV